MTGRPYDGFQVYDYRVNQGLSKNSAGGDYCGDFILTDTR